MSERDAAVARRHVLVLCVALATALLLVLIVVDLSGRLTGVDTRGILALRTYASPPLTDVMLAASSISHGRVAIPFALCVTAILARVASPGDAVIYAGACLGSELVMIGIKEAVRHHRPVGISPKLTDAGWYSFPSGHTMLAVVIFGLAAWVLSARASPVARAVALSAAAVLVLLVGLSRVYLGAHWPSDVVGAVLAGVACAATALLIRSYRPYNRA